MAEVHVTRNQQRAQAAYDRIKGAEDRKEKWRDDYGRQCMRLPSLIQQCGLCQTVAFFEAKGASKDAKEKSAAKIAFEAVLNDLSDIMGQGPNGKKLGEKIRSAPVIEYQFLTREALACAEWMQRYSEAILKISRTDQENE